MTAHKTRRAPRPFNTQVMRSQQPPQPATCYCCRKTKSMWAAVLLKKDGCFVRMLTTPQPSNGPHSKLEPSCGYPSSTSRRPTETKVNHHRRKQTLPTWAMWCLYDELGIRPTWCRPRCRYLIRCRAHFTIRPSGPSLCSIMFGTWRSDNVRSTWL
jgi:hypothetical protein